MSDVRRVFCLLAALAVLAAVVGSSSGAPQPQTWKLVDLVKFARHRFHAYVGIRAIRLADDGAVYWTAYRQYSGGKTPEVFRWRSGRMTDLGSPGPNLTVWTVNDREQFVVGTTIFIPTCPIGCRLPPQPPRHAYLWQQGKLTDLGSLGGTDTAANTINDQGQVVGSSQVGKGMRAPFHGFLWQNARMTDLGTLGGPFSEATAVNDHGQVIGTSTTTAGKLHGFIWEHGKMTDLGTLGGSETHPLAINGHGQVIGQSATPKGTPHHFDDGVAFLWDGGKMRSLGTFRLPDYPGQDPRSVAAAIDDGGEVVGISETSDDAGRAFRWLGGKLTDLGTLGGRSSGAAAIDNQGEIVGWSDTRLVPWTAEQAPRPRPIVWRNGAKIELPVDYPSPTYATAITPSGTEILGAGGWPPHQLLLWLRR